MLNYLLKFL